MRKNRVIVTLVAISMATFACSAILGIGDLPEAADGDGGQQQQDATGDSVISNEASEQLDASSSDARCDGGGLRCLQVSCPSDGGDAGPVTTTIVGTLFDPSGNLPIYDGLVFVPNASLSPFTAGVSCSACGTVATGEPLTLTLTDTSGNFTLNNVPVGSDIPLVVEIGKWRRQITIPEVRACQTNNAGPITLPRSSAEGDMPQIAIATGQRDPIECLLLKLGIANTEFVPGAGAGHVHMYMGNGLDTNPAAPAMETLLSSPTTLANNDLVILPCQGAEITVSPTDVGNLVDYTGSGGRLFLTHYSYVWMHNGSTNWSTSASFALGGQPGVTPYGVKVDTTFPKGNAFEAWLDNNGAASAGAFNVDEWGHDVLSNNTSLSQAWLHGADGGIQYFTFNTPIQDSPATQCGRVSFLDFHLSYGSALFADGGSQFPGACTNTPFSPAEKAMAFALFDFATCLPPPPPPP